MEKHNCCCEHDTAITTHCCTLTSNSGLCQNLDELDFERGIWQAAIDDDVDRIQHMITSKNVHPDATDSYGYTALHYAVRNGKLRATRILIQLGANVNCQTRNNGSTPLHRAILSPSPSTAIIQLLLDNGADPSLLDADLCTPLQRAQKEGKTDIVDTLEQIQKGMPS